MVMELGGLRRRVLEGAGPEGAGQAEACLSWGITPRGG